MPFLQFFICSDITAGLRGTLRQRKIPIFSFYILTDFSFLWSHCSFVRCILHFSMSSECWCQMVLWNYHFVWIWITHRLLFHRHCYRRCRLCLRFAFEHRRLSERKASVMVLQKMVDTLRQHLFQPCHWRMILPNHFQPPSYGNEFTCLWSCICMFCRTRCWVFVISLMFTMTWAKSPHTEVQCNNLRLFGKKQLFAGKDESAEKRTLDNFRGTCKVFWWNSKNCSILNISLYCVIYTLKYILN